MRTEFGCCDNVKNRDDDRLFVWAMLKLSNVPA